MRDKLIANKSKKISVSKRRSKTSRDKSLSIYRQLKILITKSPNKKKRSNRCLRKRLSSMKQLKLSVKG